MHLIREAVSKAIPSIDKIKPLIDSGTIPPAKNTISSAVDDITPANDTA